MRERPAREVKIKRTRRNFIVASLGAVAEVTFIATRPAHALTAAAYKRMVKKAVKVIMGVFTGGMPQGWELMWNQAQNMIENNRKAQANKEVLSFGAMADSVSGAKMDLHNQKLFRAAMPAEPTCFGPRIEGTTKHARTALADAVSRNVAHMANAQNPAPGHLGVRVRAMLSGPAAKDRSPLSRNAGLFTACEGLAPEEWEATTTYIRNVTTALTIWTASPPPSQERDSGELLMDLGRQSLTAKSAAVIQTLEYLRGKRARTGLLDPSLVDSTYTDLRNSWQEQNPGGRASLVDLITFEAERFYTGDQVRMRRQMVDDAPLYRSLNNMIAFRNYLDSLVQEQREMALMLNAMILELSLSRRGKDLGDMWRTIESRPSTEAVAGR